MLSDKDLIKMANEGKKVPRLYRLILPTNPDQDRNKTLQQIIDDIFRHTSTKIGMNRNLVQTIYAQSP